jgi:hypothetical protein
MKGGFTMKTQQQTKEVTQTVTAMVDRLGELLQQQKAIEAEIDYRKGELRAQGLGIYEGNKYIATVIKENQAVLDTEATYKKLGKEHFLACCKVQITPAKKYLSEIDLQALTKEVKEIIKVNVKTKK